MFLALKWLTNLNAFLKPHGLDAADVRADALARVRDLSPYDAASSLVSAARNGEPILDDVKAGPRARPSVRMETAPISA